MTEQELKDKIAELEKSIDNMDGVEKVQAQNKLIDLKAKLTGNALQGILDKLNQAPQADLDALNDDIRDAQDATKTRQQQVDAFNKAYGFLKGILDAVI